MTAEPLELLESARVAVRAASALLANARPKAISTKSNPRDLVTEWDVRAEELIRQVLDERTPGVPVLGEEGGVSIVSPPRPSARLRDPAEPGLATGTSELRWLVDPIDGTVNFAHGLPVWSVSIAVERAGELLAGVVAAPALGWWFEGSLGGGARDGTGAPLTVSAVERLDHALLSTGFPYDIGTNPLNNLAEWDALQRKSAACRRLGSAALDTCYVAAGWCDGYWERHLKPWDIAAGVVIAREAGATVTAVDGGAFDVHRGTICVTNGRFHGELLAELAAVRAMQIG